MTRGDDVGYFIQFVSVTPPWKKLVIQEAAPHTIDHALEDAAAEADPEMGSIPLGKPGPV